VEEDEVVVVLRGEDWQWDEGAANLRGPPGKETSQSPALQEDDDDDDDDDEDDDKEEEEEEEEEVGKDEDAPKFLLELLLSGLLFPSIRSTNFWFGPTPIRSTTLTLP
jgi:hypothetical protein